MRHHTPSTPASRAARHAAGARRAAVAEAAELVWQALNRATEPVSTELTSPKLTSPKLTSTDLNELASTELSSTDLPVTAVVGAALSTVTSDFVPAAPMAITPASAAASAVIAATPHPTRRELRPARRRPTFEPPEWLRPGRIVGAAIAAFVVVTAGTAVARAGALSEPPLDVPQQAQAAGFLDASGLPAGDSTAGASPAAGTSGTGAGTGDVSTTGITTTSAGAPRPASAWVASVADATGLDPIAVRAYGAATLASGASDPTCGLGWATLAAIGTIESGNGTFGGATLLPNGHTSVPILGPALNGDNGTAAIPSTAESVAWHGDQQWEHAVGPMQVLASTWDRWATDGDGDGMSDPTDLDDAAAMAARYLCANGAVLTTPTGWHDAIYSYNHAESYVAQVASVAAGYVKATRP